MNTRHWREALKRAGIADFRWHDLRHTWASWLRQNDVPTWVLQELGGWKSETMIRRYAHMSVKHLQPYADQLIFTSYVSHEREAQKSGKGNVTFSLTRPRGSKMTLAPSEGKSLI